VSPALQAAATGFALGWSVAWPPGPINAEIVRRGLARGFLPAFVVGLGAGIGDATWALVVGLGAGALAASAQLAALLSLASVVLLLGLSAHYLRGALRRWRDWRVGVAPPAGTFDSTRAGFAFGLSLALTSPFNVAFWLAVVGRPEVAGRGADMVLITAAAVIAGTFAWVLVLASSVVLFRARVDAPLWDIATRVFTGALLAYFAVRGMVGI
jgi:threonine/homoserine/homoserine lactone efflux protein